MKKLINTFIIVLMLAIFILPTTVSAETSEEIDGISAEIITNSAEYKKDDPLNLTVNVKNNTGENLQNVKVEVFLPEELEFERGFLSSSRLDIESGAVKGFSTDALLKNGSDSISALNLDRSDATTKTNPATIIGVLLTVLIAAGVIVCVVFIIIKPKTVVRIVCIALSAVLLLGLIPIGMFVFADRDVIMYVDKTVTIDGKKVDITAKITRYEEAHSQNVAINIGEALYDTKQNIYHTKTDLRTLSGQLFNDKYVESAKVTVNNEIDKLLFEGEFSPAKEFKVEKFGLVVGINKVKFTINHFDGFCYEEEFIINNLLEENMDNISVDRGDNDSDGVLNYIEEIKKTDINKPDTDADELTDYQEIAIVGTDPLKTDTDDNGVSDADEDSDFDEISNIVEIEEYNTNPAFPDTDGDSLDDKKEVEETKTDPLKDDTDSDGKTDKWELDKGFDPVVPNESFPKSEAESEVEEVRIESDGEATVTQVEGDLNISDDIPGLIGVPPFEVEVESGSEATIYIEYNPEDIGGETPVLYEYDTATQNFVEVENVTVDSGTVQFSTTKSGLYILLNYRYMEDVWENDILRPSENNPDAAIDIVFVIDRSASMDQNDPNGYRKEVTKKFVEKLRDDKDRAGIVQFSSIGETISPLTHDKQMVYNAVDGIVNSDGGCADETAGTNGSAGIREAFNQLEGSTAGHKFIIFLTDGEDTSVSEDYGDSEATHGLTKEAREKGVVIHTIGLIGTGGVNVDLLKTVAAGAKGNYYKLTVTEDEAEVQSQYYEVFEEIESITIDRQLDSNNDGISDYYTRLICEGKISSSTGKKFLFGSATFDEVQSSDDFDGDGLLNGQELEITENEKGVYVKLNSYPHLVDSDKDGLNDKDEAASVISPLKFNASAFAPEIEWLTGDENFASFDYLDYYVDSDYAQTAVFVGNVFFGSTLDMTAAYRQKIVDMFVSINEKVTELHTNENYRQLVIEYYNGALDVMSEELHKYFDAEDETSFVEGVKILYDFLNNTAKDMYNIKEGLLIGKAIEETDAVEVIAKSIMTSRDITPLDNEIFKLKYFIEDAPTHIAGSADAVAGKIAGAQKKLKDFEILKGEKLADITIKADKFSKTLKKIEKVSDVLDNVGFVIGLGQTAYDNYTNYTKAIAAIETVEDNMYILECISCTDDAFLNSAAITLKRAFSEAVDGNKLDLMNLSIQDATVSIGLEVVHKVIGTLGAPGAIIEAVRTFGDLILDASDNAKSAQYVVAAANTAKYLSENLNDHIEGGDAVRIGDYWYAYSSYSKDFLNCLVNLAVIRIDAEDTYAKWDCMKVGKSEEAAAKANIEKARGLLNQYNMKYSYCMSVS